MPDPQPTNKQLAEDLAATIEDVIVSLGAGVGKSQSALDRASIEIQKQIAEDPVLAQYGVEPTWYQIPSTQLELKVAIAVHETPAPTTPTPGTVTPVLPLPTRRIIVQPLNAKYANQFGFDYQAASTITLTIVPVPPPGGSSVRPTKTEAEALAAAQPFLVKASDGSALPRVTTNFNAGARAWYVVQTDESKDPVALRALVKIDDDTLAVLKHS